MIQLTGICILDDANMKASSLSLDDVNRAATNRLNDLQQRILNRGVDLEEPFRFVEILKKDEGRYHLPLSWKSQENLGTPLPSSSTESIVAYHEWMEAITSPVLERLWKDEFKVVQSGFVVNQPGSTDYQWSRECDEEGYMLAFSPLEDLKPEMGPREVWPKSHLTGDYHDSRQMLPLLRKGQILLYDRRMLYQDLANTSSEWIMGYTVLRKGERHASDFSTPDALTLEYD